MMERKFKRVISLEITTPNHTEADHLELIKIRKSISKHLKEALGEVDSVVYKDMFVREIWVEEVE